MADTGIQYIDVEEFTKNARIEESNSYFPVIGEGIFDKLMETATKHLTAQYKASRIRKEDYADLYAHIYEVTLQSALMAWLQKPEQAAKVELLNAQTEHEYVKIDQTKEQTKLIIEQTALTHEQTLHEVSKRLNTEAETKIKEKQIWVMEAQIANIKADTAYKRSQVLNTYADTQVKQQQMKVMRAQIDNTKAETILKKAQKKNVDMDTRVKEKQIHTTAIETLVKMAQIKYLKSQTRAVDKEEQVKEAQAESEKMKANLYARQIEGFDEDYKQKILKILLDSWAVGFSVSKDVFAEDVNQIPYAMSRNAINDVFQKAVGPDIDINKYKNPDIVTSSSDFVFSNQPNTGTSGTGTDNTGTGTDTGDTNNTDTGTQNP